MDSDRIRTLIEEALSVSVQGIQLPGIYGAEMRNVPISSKQLQRAAAQLQQHGHGEIKLSAEVELFLRISNTDALSSIEHAVFQVQVSIEKNDLRAVASSNKDWAQAWERGIEPIKQATLQGVRRDVWNMYGTLAEDSYTCQAAMVLLASELVGPCADRIATFLEYPLDLVRVIGARLHEAKIWEDDEVHYESWSDPQKGAVAFLLDLMVAEGELIRKWSGEKKQYAYHRADIREVSHLAV
jgi:hypothetical protein